MSYPARPLAERFAPKVRLGPGCWEWTAGKGSHGYGELNIVGRGMQLAHRIAWELAFGPVPDGLDVCHHCDNRPCVRPEHLFLGYWADRAVTL